MKIKNSLHILVVLTYLLIVWGAIVRGTESGLGCPDWPLCHGQMIPPFRADVWIEYIHRLLASLLCLGTLGVTVQIWSKAELRKKVGMLSLASVALLVFQSLLGAKVVLTELMAGLVAIHLVTALLFISLLIAMILKVENRWGRPINFLYLGVLVLLLGQMILGALTAATHSGLACPEFPMCQGGVFLPPAGLPLLHFAHRWLGIVLMGLIGWIAYRGWRCPIVKAIFFLGFVQVLLGIGNIFMGLPIGMRIAHSAVPTLLFILLFVMTYGSRKRTN